ncbi:FIVAR domain-containing protein [Enterococcus sp. CSURQ0835]|uniref:FIVAR domain-containing protein n=1 Tax=Enterococcus sp. CSURQ0835 TaxID=2681394 RepID=UPI001359F927|nr:FIVAR domain-containing protein [Enterococcus sp. CSURQ0835]
MKKKVILSLGAIVGLGLVMASSQDASAASANELYRLYNPNSGEHFYTLNAGERDGLVKAGWNNEGIGWYTPEKGDTVYRLYNPNAGDHHYTDNKGEYDNLVKIGWTGEGESFKSDTAKTVPIYRAYNPNAKAGAHNFTPSKDEQTGLVAKGWDDEGIGFYGVNKEDEKVNKDALNKAIADVKGANDNYDRYTVDSFAPFRVAFNEASKVAADDKATQADVDAAKAALDKAAAGLEFEAVKDATALKGLVDGLDGQDYIDAKYTPEEFVAGTADAYVKAVDAAKKVLDDPEATPEQLTTAFYDLTDAKAALKKPFSSTDAYKNLDKAVKALATLKADNYTKLTWDNLQAALPAAQAALKATEDTPENETAATTALTNLDTQYKALAFINTAKSYNDQFGKKADKYVYAENQFDSAADYNVYTAAADDLAQSLKDVALKGDKTATDALAAKETTLYNTLAKLTANVDKTAAAAKKAQIDDANAKEPTVAYTDLAAFVAAQ